MKTRLLLAYLVRATGIAWASWRTVAYVTWLTLAADPARAVSALRARTRLPVTKQDMLVAFGTIARVANAVSFLLSVAGCILAFYVARHIQGSPSESST
jgi:hypothetical protein